MRILQLGRFWHSQHGGVERHAEVLSRQLAEAGHDVVNLVASADKCESDTVQDGYRLVQTPTYGTFARTPLSPSQIFKALQLHKESPFDLMHLHFPDPLAHLISLFMPREVLRVISWHSDIIKQKSLLRFYRPWLSRVTRKADAVVAATQAHFDASTQIPLDVHKEKRHIIPYGLNFDNLSLDAESCLKRNQLLMQANGRPIVFALGRHVYYKGFDILINAMQHVDALLILGGDGPLRNQLKAQAEKIGVAEKVIFVGRIPEAELGAYFHACDVFCLPSVEQSEAFGLVQLEAMACGKPVVCTQLDNGVNVVHQHGVTGWAVPPRDSIAFSAALQHLLKNPDLRRRMGMAAKERAFSEYSAVTMTKKHIDLYTSLLRDSRK
jgi:rhamnosyl/mannosyltransferase